MSVLEARRRGVAKKYTWKKYTVAQAYTTKATAVNESFDENTGGGWVMYSYASSENGLSVNGSKFSMPGRTYPADYAANLYNSYRFFVPAVYSGSYKTEYDTIYYCDTASGNVDYNTAAIHASKKYTRVLTSQRGSYIEDVTSADESAYPTDGVQNGYWYVRQ